MPTYPFNVELLLTFKEPPILVLLYVVNVFNTESLVTFNEFNDDKPDDEKLPTTSNLLLGFLVPIPTLPSS